MSKTPRTQKNQPGDWVAMDMPGAVGGQAPAKVIACGYEDDAFGEEAFVVTLAVRIGGKPETRKCEGPLPRIRWRRQNGSARWEMER